VWTLSEYLCAIHHLGPKHILHYILQLFLSQVVKDEMIFQAIDNKSLIVLGLYTPLGIDSLIAESHADIVESNSLIFFTVLMHFNDFYRANYIRIIINQVKQQNHSNKDISSLILGDIMSFRDLKISLERT